MRWRLSAAGLVSAAGLLLAGRAGATRPPLAIQERDYDCKIIASTREFPGLPADDPPRMNAWGQVAFLTQDPSTNLQQIRVGHGDLDGHGHPITRLLGENAYSSGTSGTLVFGVGEPTIEDGGFVVFGGAKTTATGGGSAIFREPWFGHVDNSSAPLVQSVALDPQSPYLGFRVVSTNSVSSLLFQDGDGPHRRLYVSGNLVAQEGAGGVQELDDGNELIAPGNSTFYGFKALLDTGEDAIVVNGTVREHVLRSGSVMLFGLAVNGNIVPVASYVRLDTSVQPNRWTLEFESDLGHATYVDSAIDPISVFYTYSFATSINAWNEVAFVAEGGVGPPDASRLFVTDGRQITHVHCQNMEQTFGAPFFTVEEISPRALNDDGQIAFLGRTATPDTFLVRAGPIPGQSARPTSCTGLDDGTPCDDGNPVTISSCQGQVCVGQPTGFATSCEGQPDSVACDAAGEGMQGYCKSQQCVGVSPVPEPDLPEDAVVAVLVVFWIRPRHTRSCRRSSRPSWPIRGPRRLSLADFPGKEPPHWG